MKRYVQTEIIEYLNNNKETKLQLRVHSKQYSEENLWSSTLRQLKKVNKAKNMTGLVTNF